MGQRAADLQSVMFVIAGLGACSPAHQDVVGESGTTGAAAETSTTGPSDDEGPDGSGSVSSTATLDDSSSGEPAGSSSGELAGSSSGEPADTTGSLTCATIVYVHFDGITLTEGPDDARTNTTGIAELAIELAPYAGNDREQIIALAASRFADFDVCFTDQRPAQGDYTMAIVTPTSPFGTGTFGIAALDCENANPNNIVFAFSFAAMANSVVQGWSIARSLGISFGLNPHSDDPADIMSIFSAENTMFLDACMSLDDNMPQCPHDPCRGGDQNSYQELLARLGPAR